MDRLTINGVAAPEYKLPEHKRGTTFPGLSFAIAVNGNTDITDASIVLNVEDNLFSTINEKIIITDAVNGVFQIVEQIIDIPIRNYRYELIITFANGDVEKYLEGHWNIIE